MRLAGLLRSGLTGVTFVLDEPGSGLHPRDLESLVGRLRTLCDEGNTVVVVSHRPEILRAADHWIEVGPGAGSVGGRIVEAGPAQTVLRGDGPTALALREPVQIQTAETRHLNVKNDTARTVVVLPCQKILAGGERPDGETRGTDEARYPPPS